MKNTNEDLNKDISKNGSAGEHNKNAEPNSKNTSENTISTKEETNKEDEHKKRKLNKESIQYLLGI